MIIYVGGQQIEVDEKEIEIYNPFPEVKNS